MGPMRARLPSIQRLHELLLEVLAPGRCAFCAAPGACVCQRCMALLPSLVTACRRCALPLAGAAVCGRCQADPPAFSGASAAFRYEFPVDTAIKAFKFRRQLYYVPAFVQLLAPLLRERHAHCDGLVPVPLHRWRQARRGFNQATELARGLAAETGIPLAANLRRVRATAPQSGLSAGQRRSNLRGAFAIAGGLEYRRPLIVDDVITTGHTCDQLARVLLAAGAQSVEVLAVARADQAARPQPAAATGLKV